jgi:hypothetical protein
MATGRAVGWVVGRAVVVGFAAVGAAVAGWRALGWMPGAEGAASGDAVGTAESIAGEDAGGFGTAAGGDARFANSGEPAARPVTGALALSSETRVGPPHGPITNNKPPNNTTAPATNARINLTRILQSPSNDQLESPGPGARWVAKSLLLG